MKIEILGCGSSTGVPVLGYGYYKCDPNEPKNNRTRSSALITTDDNKKILIDMGPDIRMQLLKAGNPLIDAVLITHTHYDHIGGLDDLRFLARAHRTPIDIYMSKDAEKKLDHMKYIFDLAPIRKNIIEPMKSFKIGETEFLPIKQYHGGMISLGFRFEDTAYSTDLKLMDPEGFEALKGLKTWIFGLASPNGNEQHASVDEFLEWEKYLKPQKVFLTHMDSELDYQTVCKYMPPHIRPCYDGMEIHIEKSREKENILKHILQSKNAQNS